ncbi:MAG: NUDIX hydrolase [Saccharothrix sp.]|nr:NUDIX hydrolase [Saccharothrix sp.]
MREMARLTADVVMFARHEDRMHLLLIQRAYDPFAGRWALPGGHVDPGEDTFHAAVRELREETGMTWSEGDDPTGVGHLVGVYAAPGRDPRGRYVTFAYATVLGGLVRAVAADDASAVRWVPLAEIAANPDLLAFDHGRIVGDALTRLGIEMVNGHLLKMTNRLVAGDVVTRDHPDGRAAWWRIDSTAGTDQAGRQYFAAQCVDSDNPEITTGTWALFEQPAARAVYLRH